MLTKNAISCLTLRHRSKTPFPAPAPPPPFTPCPAVKDPGVVVHPEPDLRLRENHASSSASVARRSLKRYWNMWLYRRMASFVSNRPRGHGTAYSSSRPSHPS